MTAPEYTPTRHAYRQANAYRIDGNDAHITLTDRQGQTVAEAAIDRALLDDVLAYGRWHRATIVQAGKTFHYAVCSVRTNHPTFIKRGMRVYMHRVVLELSGLGIAGQHVDHIDGNTLDNRRLNLHAGTPQDNTLNHYHSRNERLLRSVVRGLLTCGHTRQDCPCKRLAVAVLEQTERRTA